MKKYISLILILAALFILSSCDNSNIIATGGVPETEIPETKVPVSEPTETVPTYTTEVTPTPDPYSYMTRVDNFGPEVGYRIYTDYCELTGEEEYYVVMTGEEYKDDTGYKNNWDSYPGIDFESVKEMRDKIFGGTLSDYEKNELSSFARDEKGRILLRELNEYMIYEPVLPEELVIYNVNIGPYGEIHLDIKIFTKTVKKIEIISSTI